MRQSTPNFDSLAQPYRWLEYLSFGPTLHRARIHFLPQLASRRHALVLGDGDGRFTAALLQNHPQVRVHAVDISPSMLAALQKAAGPFQDRLTIEVADLRDWRPQPGTQYDLVVTHFFLDCLTTEQVASLARRLRPGIAANAIWIISDFAIPNTSFGQWIARPLVASLYVAFALLTGLPIRELPNHALALTRAGWSLTIHRPTLNGILTSQLWEREAPDPEIGAVCKRESHAAPHPAKKTL